MEYLICTGFLVIWFQKKKGLSSFDVYFPWEAIKRGDEENNNKKNDWNLVRRFNSNEIASINMDEEWKKDRMKEDKGEDKRPWWKGWFITTINL